MAVQMAGESPGIFNRIGAEGAAVHIGVIQSSQHNDGGGGIKLVGQRKQQGHTGRLPIPGIAPTTRPRTAPKRAAPTLLKVNSVEKPCINSCIFSILFTPFYKNASKSPIGKWTPSHIRNTPMEMAIQTARTMSVSFHPVFSNTFSHSITNK